MEELVAIARILRTRGVRGELVAEILTDFPERFEAVRRVTVRVGSRLFEEVLEDHWFHKGRVILKFRGRDRPDESSELIPGEVLLPEAERATLPEDYYYHDHLIGCRILDEGGDRGSVVEVFRASSEQSLLVVLDERGREVMVPLVREFVREIDVDSRKIRVTLPEGLLDLAEEKRRQGGRRRRRKDRTENKK